MEYSKRHIRRLIKADRDHWLGKLNNSVNSSCNLEKSEASYIVPDKPLNLDPLSDELTNYSTETKPCTSCINFDEKLDKIDQKLNQLIEQQKEFKGTFENQRKIIMDMLAKQTDNSLSQTGRTTTSNISEYAFPVKTSDCLLKLESSLNDSNMEAHICIVKNLLNGDPIKNVEKVLSREFCMNYNVHGICGKKGLHEAPQTLKMLLAAIGAFTSDPQKKLKHMFQIAKKRHFRQKGKENAAKKTFH